MNCTTCGRENPPHLTFCQECGQRLGPRVAPPTPPIGIGLGASEPEPRTDIPVASAYAPRAMTALGGTVATPSPLRHGTPPPPAVQPPPPVHLMAGTERPCRVCATPNAPGLRYCTSCGSTLEPLVTASGSAPRMVEPAPVAPPPAAGFGPPLSPPPSPFVGGPYGPNPVSPVASPASFDAIAPAAIAPNRVVDLGAGARPTNEGPRICARCRGVVDPNAQFCKFCGAPLADAAGSVAQPPNGHAYFAATTVDQPARGQSTPVPAAAPADPFAGRSASAPPVAAGAAALAAAPASPPRDVRAASAAAPAPIVAPVVSPAPIPARSPSRGRLVVIAKSGADGPSYPFGDTLDVGRVEGQIIVGEDPYLSPRHVRIAWTGSKLVLRDLASTNGVYIRLVAARDLAAQNAGKAGRASTPRVDGEVAVPLRDQDLILVGQQVLRFELVTDGEVGFGPATEHGTLLFGSPAAPRYARLSQRTVEGVTRDVYYVRKAETVLGRESGDVVFTEDPFLSRRHAAIRVLGTDPAAAPGKPVRAEGLSFALVDLGSSNGSFLRIRSEIELLPGDHFRVGQQLFRVDFDASSSAGTVG